MRKIYFVMGYAGVFIAAIVTAGPHLNFELVHYLAGLSLVITSAAILTSVLQTRFVLEANKRKAAVDFRFVQIRQELFPLFEKLKTIFGPDILKGMSGLSVLKHLMDKNLPKEQKDEVKVAVDSILLFYEGMAIGILKRVLDEDICYSGQGHHLVTFGEWSKSYIKDISIFPNQQEFINFEELGDRWKRRRVREEKARNKHLRRVRKVNAVSHRDL